MSTSHTGADGAMPSEPNRLPPTRLRVRPRNRLADYPPVVPPPTQRMPAETAAENGCKPQDAYGVGYKKPPVASRFKPGQSGNLRGRPVGAKGLNTIARTTLTQKMTVRTADGVKKMSAMEVLLQKMLEQAMKGNARAFGDLLRLYAAAVPETKTSDIEVGSEDLTAADLAMLEDLRRSLTEPVDTDAPREVLRTIESALPEVETGFGNESAPDELDDPPGPTGDAPDYPDWNTDWDRSL